MSAYVEIVFDNSDNRLPVRSTNLYLIKVYCIIMYIIIHHSPIMSKSFVVRQDVG